MHVIHTKPRNLKSMLKISTSVPHLAKGYTHFVQIRIGLTKWLISELNQSSYIWIIHLIFYRYIFNRIGQMIWLISELNQGPTDLFFMHFIPNLNPNFDIWMWNAKRMIHLNIYIYQTYIFVNMYVTLMTSDWKLILAQNFT